MCACVPAAVFWHTTSYHLWFEGPGDVVYYMMLVGFAFLLVTLYNIFKEAQEVSSSVRSAVVLGNVFVAFYIVAITCKEKN